MKSGTYRDCSSPINLFTPEFMIWTLPSLNLDAFILANRDLSEKSITEW